MSPASKPDKHQVRKWWNERREKKGPPPSPDEIRRILGWGMLQNNDTKR